MFYFTNESMISSKQYGFRPGLYYSLVYPYLPYACTLWGNNYNAPLSHVKLQNIINGINNSTLRIPKPFEIF